MYTVSVVMPLYNAEQYVEEAIRSVLAQTYPDFELLIIDDGSTDRSGHIAGSISDSRVRLVWQKHRGVAGARNTGISLASGQYIALLDAADRWSPDKLERHVRHLRENPDIGVSYSQSSLVDEKGRSLGVVLSSKLNGVTSKDVLCRNPVANSSAAVLRAEALEAIKHEGTKGRACYFDETLAQFEDMECWLRIVATTPWRLAGIASPLTWNRVPSTESTADLEAHFCAWSKVLQKTATLAPDLVRRHGSLAQALQYRLLARRAILSRDPEAALVYARRALTRDIRLLISSPIRTIATLGRACLLNLFPPGRFEGPVYPGMHWTSSLAARWSSNRNVRLQG